MNEEQLDAFIMAQYSEAKTHFGSLNMETKRDLSITFAANSPKYSIAFSSKYPQEAPTVYHGSQAIELPILAMWLNVYQIFHIVEQIKLYDIENHQAQLTLNQEDVDKLLSIQHTSTLQDDFHRRALLLEMPCIKHAQSMAQQSRQDLDKYNSRIADLTNLIEDCRTEITSLFSTRSSLLSELRSIDAEIPRRLHQAIQSALDGVRKSIEESDPSTLGPSHTEYISKSIAHKRFQAEEAFLASQLS